MDVYCVGQIVVDVLVKPVSDVNFDVDTIKVNNICLRTGGDCSNTAIVLSKLGNKVGITKMESGKMCSVCVSGFSPLYSTNRCNKRCTRFC